MNDVQWRNGGVSMMMVVRGGLFLVRRSAFSVQVEYTPDQIEIVARLRRRPACLMNMMGSCSNFLVREWVMTSGPPLGRVQGPRRARVFSSSARRISRPCRPGRRCRHRIQVVHHAANFRLPLHDAFRPTASPNGGPVFLHHPLQVVNVVQIDIAQPWTSDRYRGERRCPQKTGGGVFGPAARNGPCRPG